jgi:hypothetical protein
MAVLSQDEARRARAQKHAQRVWTCPICGKKCRGNGGKSSHQNKHKREMGLTTESFGYLYQKWKAGEVGQKKGASAKKLPPRILQTPSVE